MSDTLNRLECYGFSLICVMLALAFTVAYRGKNKDIAWLFVVMNSAALAFFFAQESTLLNRPSLSFSILMTACLFVFPLGYYLVRQNRPRDYRVRDVLVDLSARFENGRMALVNRLGFVFYFSAYSMELKNAGWVFPVFAANKLEAYYNFPVQFVHYLVVASIPMTIIYGYLRWICGRAKTIDHVVVLLSVVLNTMMLARAVVMTQVFMIIYFWFVGKGYRVSSKLVILGSLGLLLFITVFGFFRTGDTLRVILEIGGLGHWHTALVPLSWPYLYFSTSIENFRNIFDSTDLSDIAPLTFGFRYATIYLYTLFQNKEMIPHYGEAEFSAGGFNTFGMYLSAYYDFYVLFPLLFLLLGFLFGVARSSSSLVVRLFFPYIVYVFFTSPVNDYFSSFFTLIYAVYIALVVGLSRRFKFRLER